MLERYLDHLREQGRSPAYIDKQRRVLTRLLPDPQAALASLAARATETTVRDARNRLRCYGAWLGRTGQEDPFLAVSAPAASRASQDRATITREEVQQLLACEAVPAQRRALWHLLAVTGLRPVEASRVTPEHLVRQGGEWTLVLPAALQKARRADPIGLTAKEAKLIRDHCPLVTGAVDKLYRFFRRDLEAAGLPVEQNGVARTPYCLRSYFITSLLSAGADLETVRMLARHADIQTTLRHYARHNRSAVAKARRAIITH
jgi:integrase